MKRILSGLAATTTLAAALTIGVSTTAQADGYSFLKAQELEQTVLRAQMPKTLGTWTQNYYYTDTRTMFTVPTLCWDAKGTVELPAAKNVGAVGYAIGSSTSGSVSVYQYADAAKAQAALAALQGASCSNSPTVVAESGAKVEADSGSDFTNEARTSYGAGLSYIDDGMLILTDIRTTQVGLAIVQTEVFRAVDASRASEGQRLVNRLGSTNKSWHRQAVAAYESFGQGNAR